MVKTSKESGLKPVYIEAFDLDDAWFQCLSRILESGYVYKIDRGSYAGQHRLEFDFATVRYLKFFGLGNY